MPTSTPAGLSFYAEATARFDNLSGGFWQRVFDFGNGPGQQNILLTQVGNSDSIRFEVYNATGLGSLSVEVPNAIIPGEVATWRAQVSDAGQMQLFKNDVLIGERAGVFVPDVPRSNLLVAESNWGGDTPLIGAVTAIVADVNGDGVADVEQGTAPAPTPTPTPTPTPGAITEDFNGGASGWTNNQTDSGAGNGYLGRLGTALVEKSFALPSGATTATISFDFLEIDSWDGESFFVTVNGREINLGAFGWTADEGATSFNAGGGITVSKGAAVKLSGYGNETDFWAFNDSAHRFTLTVANPGETLTLGFRSTLNQELNDESFGIDNLSITTDSTAPTPTPTPEPEPEPEPTPTPTPGAITEDFNAGASGWTNNQTDSGAGNGYLGRLGTALVEKSFALPSGATTATISFDFLEIDSWDGESFFVTVNGREINLGAFGWTADEGATSFNAGGGITVSKGAAVKLSGYGNETDFWAFNDSAHRFTLTVANPGETLTLGFRSTLNQELNDESFGIDNLSITTDSTAPTPTPTPEPEPTPDGTAFIAEATVRFDDLSGGAWQRVFDFGNGPGQDNILLTQLAGTNTMRFDIYTPQGLFTLDAVGAIIQGETADWTARITTDGTMQILKNGTLLAETNAVVPQDVPRANLLIGESNWPADTDLIGAVSVTADIDGDGTTDVSGNNGTAPPAPQPIITGTPGNDNLTGTPGDDIFDSGTGTDAIDGGAGFDLARLEGAASDYQVFGDELNRPNYVNLQTGSATLLDNVEQVEFKATGEIRDVVDPSATPTPGIALVATGQTTLVEGPAGSSQEVIFSAELTNATNITVTADYVVAGSNLVQTNGSVTIQPGQTAANFAVQFLGDDIPEPNETISVTLTNIAGANAGNVTASFEVIDDDATPTPSPNTPPVANDDPGGATSANFPVTVDVLQNDFDADGDTLTLTDVAVTSGQGSANIVDNKLLFTPADGFNDATAEVTYTVSDGNGGTATATAFIYVQPSVAPPPTTDGPLALTNADSGNRIIDTLTHDFRWNDNVITYGFQDQDVDGNGISDFNEGDWRPFFGQIFDNLESFLDLDFQEVSYADARIQLQLNGTVGVDGRADLPDPYGNGKSVTSIGKFGNTVLEGAQIVDAGETASIAFWHEIGHSLGLVHPFLTTNGLDDNTGSDRFEDFLGPLWTAPGDHYLNSNSYTVMTYAPHKWGEDNPLTPEFDPNSDVGFGNGSYAPFDIAALQYLYGKNTTTALGNDVYSFNDNLRASDGVRTIWDNGGTDTIVYNGGQRVVINLNDATLQREIGGGGFLSTNESKQTGFLIANGVVIENATGGFQSDVLTGNEFANTLNGGGGNDVLNGGGGNDVLIGGTGSNTLNGGTGFDRAVLSGTNANTSVTDTGGGTFVVVGPDGAVQTLSGVEELFFQQTGEVRFLKGAEPDQPVVDGPDPVPTAPAPYIEPPAEPEPPAGGGGDTTVPDPLPGNGGTFVANPTGGELVGTNGNDVLLGSFTDDFVYGFDGDDFANLSRGSDSFYGGAGQDTVLVPGAPEDYNLSVGGAGQLIFLPTNIAEIFTNTKLVFDTEVVTFEGSGQSFTYAQLAGTAIVTNSMLGVPGTGGGHTHHEGCGHVHDYSIINERLGIDTSSNDTVSEPHNHGCPCAGCAEAEANSINAECAPLVIDETLCEDLVDDACIAGFV